MAAAGSSAADKHHQHQHHHVQYRGAAAAAAKDDGGLSSPSSGGPTSSFGAGGAASSLEGVDKELVRCLSELEAGAPEDKLEFVFRLFDTDGNGYLDASEVDAIISQMMKVTEYLGWDTSELLPILKDMMTDLDFDADGTVSLEEWKRGGLTTIPLLVLLGLDTTVKDDGSHVWRLKHFAKGRHCNICLKQLVGLGKQGLGCVFCKYTAHAKCVSRAPASCIFTYTKSKRPAAGTHHQTMLHHWTEGNCVEKCAKCRKSIKSGITGLQCRWCKVSLHNKCAEQWSTECDLGALREHILPPTAIFPAVLDRGRTPAAPAASGAAGGSGLPSSQSTGSQLDQLACSPHQQSSSFQISPPTGCVPLLVFINPKSGGKQGVRILHKMQYILNPRQVYDLVKDGGPYLGLNFFRDLPAFRILVCGGDGTAGWLLEAMDKFDWGDRRPPVAVLPLGTGNDLARCLRWGGGYENERLEKILHRMAQGSVVLLDRWKINFSEPVPEHNGGDAGDSAAAVGGSEASVVEPDEASTSAAAAVVEPSRDEIPATIINNYFSIGVDAAIAHRWHLMREKHPEKFKSRFRNKAYYVEMGATEVLGSSCKNLHENLDIICDGYALDLGSGTPLEGMALLNINSVYGGRTLWENNRKRSTAAAAAAASASASSSGGGRDQQAKRKQSSGTGVSRDRELSSASLTNNELAFAVQDMGDQLIEVVGLENAVHAGMVAGGLRSSGKRLAQCSEVVIRTRRRFPMQIDGEPWSQAPCTISVTHMNQVPMIMAPPAAKKGGLFGLFSK